MVEISGVQSDTFLSTKTGVLQGSALSATLFVLYLNDFVYVEANKSKYLYADDSHISNSEKKIADVISETKVSIKKHIEWFHTNKMEINSDKTEIVLFNTKNSTEMSSISEIEIDAPSCIFPLAGEFVRYLGFWLNGKLKFKKFFDNAITNISYGTYSLSRIKATFPTHTKLMIYHSFVHSHLQHISLYYNLASTPTKKRLFKIQKKALRYVLDAPHRSHTANMFQLTNVLPLPIMYKFNAFKFVHYALKDSRLNELKKEWKFNVSSFRNKHKLAIPFFKSSRLDKFPITDFPRIYNELIDTFSSDTIAHKFSNLHEHMLNKYAINNECKNKRNCYICRMYGFSLEGRREEIREKLARKNLVIEKKECLKAERYSLLAEKAGLSTRNFWKNLLKDV